MDEKFISIVIACSLALILLIISFINKKVLKTDSDNSHLKTYDEDYDLYPFRKSNAIITTSKSQVLAKEVHIDESCYEVTENNVIEDLTEEDLIETPSLLEATVSSEIVEEASQENIVEQTSATEIIITDTALQSNLEEVSEAVQTAPITTNLTIYNLSDIDSSDVFRPYEKELLNHKLKEVSNTEFTSFFTIIDVNTNVTEKQFFLKDDVKSEKEIIEQISKYVVDKSNLQVIYVANFGIIKEYVREVFDLY